MHPILQEYAVQIPKNIQTYRSLQEGKSFEEVGEHARKDQAAFKSLDGVLGDGRTVAEALQANGSEESIESPDALDKDRLRAVGALGLIAEFCEAMAED
jgi:hypothetical protein